MNVASKPALYVYSFAPITPAPNAPYEASEHLAGLWTACLQFGMATPVFADRSAAFPEFPTEPVGTFGVLAARGNPDPDSAYQAILFARHDTVGLVVSLAPNREEDDLGRWTRLLDDWVRAVPSTGLPKGLLGEVLMFTALTDLRDGDTPLDVPGRFGERAWKTLSAAGLRSWQDCSVTREGFALWEGEDESGRRIVAIIAPASSERALDEWIWWKDQRELVPLARYLLNASKLDYESRVYPLLKREMERSLSEVDGPLEAVLLEDSRLGDGDRLRLDHLLEAQARLIRAQQHSTGLLHALSRIKELQQTVQIADANCRLAAPLPYPEWNEPGDSMFVRDQRLAQWLNQQIDHDLNYAGAVLERATGALSLTSLRLQQAADRHARQQNRVTLLQTTIIATLGSALGAIATFGLRFHPPDRLRGPLLAGLVTFLLALPPLAVHWHERYRLFDHVAAMVFGGCLAWLATAFFWSATPWPATVTLAAAGVAVARLLTYVHDQEELVRRLRGRRTVGRRSPR